MTSTLIRAQPVDDRRVLRLLVARFPLIVFALLLVYLSVSSEFFLEWRNISSILRQSAPDAILAAGLAVVVTAGGDDIVSGGIDISLPAAATLGVGILSDQLVGGRPIGLAMLLAAAAVVAVGVVNSLLVIRVGLTPLLATLASWVAVVGITKWVTNNRRITVDNPFINEVRDGTLAAVPIPAVFALCVLVVFTFWVHRTRFGLQLQASGGSRAAAEISGLNPDYYLARAFVIASLARGGRGSGADGPGLGTVARHRGAAVAGHGAGDVRRRSVLASPGGDGARSDARSPAGQGAGKRLPAPQRRHLQGRNAQGHPDPDRGGQRRAGRWAAAVRAHGAPETADGQGTATAPPSWPARLAVLVSRYGFLAVFAGFVVFFAVRTDAFLNSSNLVNILEGNSVLLIVALAMTLVVASGGIDLSIGIAIDFGG